MSDLPDGLTHERHRDLQDRAYRVWVRRVALLVLLAVCAAALAGAFGQTATTSTADGPGVGLAVEAPDRLRGGLIYQGEIEVRAVRRIAQPRIVLDRGWSDGVTRNTIAPEPVDQGDEAGRLVLAYDELPAGRTLTVRIQLQVNPTTVGTRPQDVEVRDGDRVLARAERTLTIFP